jgi:hypothetical protein
MNLLPSQNLVSFQRKFRFTGGRLRKATIRYRAGRPTLDVVLRVRTAIVNLSDEPRLTRLHLRLVEVDEFRLQKRTSVGAGRIPELRLGYFNGLYCISFDAYPLEPGEVPGLHDFRASDAYAIGKELWWATPDDDAPESSSS